MYCVTLTHEGRLANELLNTLAETELMQMNGIKNSYSRTLDLVLSNISHISVNKVNGIVSEDAYHPALLVELTLNNVKFMKSKKTAKFNFFKGNYVALNNELSNFDWHNQLINMNINDTLDKFYEVIGGLIVKYVPKIQPKSHDFPKWYS